VPAAGARAGAILTIDLAAVAANWRALSDRVKPAAAAAVVKADAYGLGAAAVAATLYRAGCRTFFVALTDEALALRPILDALAAPTAGGEAALYVLGGAPRGAEPLFVEKRLRPVLNSLDDLTAWRTRGSGAPAALHLDTGMARLGLPAMEVTRLKDEPGHLDGVTLALLMSHLACADEPDHPLNGSQLQAFRTLTEGLPPVPRSLANSSGIFLGGHPRFDLVRPGAALYGVAPVAGHPNPMQGVVRLIARVLQVREIDGGDPVGYGATYRAQGRQRIATVGVGYADGFLRSLSNRTSGFIGDLAVPLVGRVSMDLITFDVTAAPASSVRPGSWIELIGPHQPVDTIAGQAGTIGYEILTALGRRYHRVYQGAGGPQA
jgi:alanine racemase